MTWRMKAFRVVMVNFQKLYSALQNKLTGTFVGNFALIPATSSFRVAVKKNTNYLNNSFICKL